MLLLYILKLVYINLGVSLTLIAIGQSMESFLMPNKTSGPRKHPQNWTVWLQHYFFPNPDIESSLYQNWKEILSSWQIRKTDKTQKAQVC